MKKYISLLLISVFLIPLIQTINAQSTTGPVGNQFSNLISSSSKYANNTPSGQAGLIENNPGYAKYVPNTSSYPNNSTNTGAGYHGSISNSANNGHNNISNPIGGALANTSKAVGNIIEKGISSITNIGNKTTK